MSVDHTEESIAYYMTENRIGSVIYVDFTPINKKPGFGENVDQVVKSAFVHFSDPWFCSDKKYHFQFENIEKNTDGFASISSASFMRCKFWEDIANGKSYKLQISSNEYWICLKNNNPVQRTMMNIHQLAENGRHLEGLIELQTKTIQEQAEKIKTLERKVEEVQEVLYQLFGGLYCQQSQQGIRILHQRVLGGIFAPHIGPLLEDTHKWGFQPTTRQGDDCERRIEEARKDY